MNKYLRLFRLNNAVIAAIGVLVACFIAAGYDVGGHAANVALGCAAVACAVAGGNALNDYVDREVDKTAHPGRPVPSGEIGPKAARACGYGGFAATILLSALTFLADGSAWAVAIAVLAVTLMAAYESVLKQRGFVGNLCIALLTGLVFVFGGALVGDFSTVWALAVLASLVSIGREIAKDIEDEESDRGSRRTLPVAIGDRAAASAAAAFFVAGPLLSFIPLVDETFSILYATVLAADAIFIYCAGTVFVDPRRAEKFAKVAMFAALLSFVLGAIQV